MTERIGSGSPSTYDRLGNVKSANTNPAFHRILLFSLNRTNSAAKDTMRLLNLPAGQSLRRFDLMADGAYLLDIRLDEYGYE